MAENILRHAALPGEQVLPRCRCLAKLQRFTAYIGEKSFTPKFDTKLAFLAMSALAVL